MTGRRKLRIRTGLAVGLLAALGMAGEGCRPPADAPASSPTPAPIVKTDDRGPIKLTVTARPAELTIADQLELTITVEADPGFEVLMPEFAEGLGGFRVRDFQEPAPEPSAAGKRTYRQVYKIDFLVSGDYTIPALTARYRDHRGEKGSTNGMPEGDEAGTPGELTTEPITVNVTSLHEGAFDPEQIRDVRPVATVRADRTWRSLAAAGIVVGAGGIVLALVLLLVRRGRRVGTEPPMPPHEWAFAQLAALADAKLIEAGEVKAFYYRLSEIVRVYIELRFGLMAPERTTEEFLAEMRDNRALPGAYQPSLAEFLEACDLVKFALYQPATEEIERVFNAARDFVAATAPAARPVENAVTREATA